VAIDLVLDQNALARQILSSNMVMIYPNNPGKQKEYEQQIVRTFYITNAEPKEVEAMLKAVLGAKNMFMDERSGSVMLRDTPDAVRMAEKLVASLDVVEPEVMLELEVLEISSSKLQDLGILYPSTATLAVSPLGAAAAAGFSAVELQFPYDLAPSAVKAELARHGLTQLGVNTPQCPEFGLAALPGRERDWEAAFKRALDYVVAIGGRAIHCMTGVVPPEQRPAAETVFIKNLERAAADAANTERDRRQLAESRDLYSH